MCMFITGLHGGRERESEAETKTTATTTPAECCSHQASSSCGARLSPNSKKNNNNRETNKNNIRIAQRRSSRSTASSSSSSSSGVPSLCHELNDLYLSMWSGKWKLVSPNHFLVSVWKTIPSFRVRACVSGRQCALFKSALNCFFRLN